MPKRNENSSEWRMNDCAVKLPRYAGACRMSRSRARGWIGWCMASPPVEQTSVASLALEPSSPEVKRYQRQKLIAQLVSMILSFAFLGLMAFWGGPKLDVLL